MTDHDATTDAPAALSLRRRLRHELVTPESIYGTIIVSALIVVVDDDENDFQLLVGVGSTVLVFWLAHVFAFTMAHHGRRGPTQLGISAALGRALEHSTGLLLAAVVPMAVLGLGAAGVLDEGTAYLAALWVGVIVLFLLGVLAFVERGARWYSCLAGGLATALLGVAVIVLKAVFH
ncbi:hypothetical protein NVV95_09565 [Herbiconiux sp. CPCC 205716]|uniref:Integral membrane protein n=1 Tax=Herbiconiux gentiana TaxID=2970912 RepID=A0ABT2GGT3_9MICO|nr:hypothetical protein [Herbiconiux gentiana]MCS5714797.1 hypothetical protein [Herbiconiux gentiana]